MTDSEINIAIAEACGWLKQVPCNKCGHGTHQWLTPDGLVVDKLTDYCHDLNAMRSAVMAQEDATWRFQFQTGLEHRAKGLGKLVCELDAHDWAMEFCMKKALWT